MSNIFDLFKKISKENENTQTMPVSYIVVGLGNPGSEYERTRHNAGFLFIELLERKLNIKVNKIKFKSLVCDTVIENKRVLIMKPQTFMNKSGEAISDAASFYKIPPENIIVIYDDINFNPGQIRVRRKGSDGGHNGIKSIIYMLGSDAFPRIKIGVGQKPHPDYDMADWVLSNIPKEHEKDMLDALEKSYEALKLILSNNIDKAMNLYN